MIDYRWSLVLLSAHDYQVLTPTDQNLEVEKKICIFGIAKSRIANVSMLELMHQEQTTHQFLERLKSTISKFLDIYTKKASF
jgi:hypothetical protein